MLGLRRFRSLVRGVSNIASRVYPTCAYLMPISGKPEIGGRPKPRRRNSPAFPQTPER
jgi:hypothetical protein